MTLPALDEPLCPLCGAANQCAAAKAGKVEVTCWCQTASFSAELLARVPDNAKDRACICPACAREGAREGSLMEPRKLKVGQAITPEEFEGLSDAQLARLVPKAYREYFPGKDFCADGYFYLHDGTAWSFFKGDFLDD